MKKTLMMALVLMASASFSTVSAKDKKKKLPSKYLLTSLFAWLRLTILSVLLQVTHCQKVWTSF